MTGVELLREVRREPARGGRHHPDRVHRRRRPDRGDQPRARSTATSPSRGTPRRSAACSSTRSSASTCRRENKRLAAQLAEYTGYLNQQLHGEFDFGNIIGESAALREVLAKVEQVAPTASTVLLRGETGTGKELVAHAIHINSPREEKPFVRVNCAALAPGVLESELFGHEKGSFTGAMERRRGRFELADGGTLFLDEVGDLPMEVQIKLLRTLQEREFERVGGTETIKVDVRVVSATNRNLEKMIEDGEFREDLYYRLNVFPINLPPLRDRLDDLPVLVDHFVDQVRAPDGRRAVAGSPPRRMAKLREYNWPGNVRELENIIERAMILARGTPLAAVHLDFGRRVVTQSAANQSGSVPVVAPASSSGPALAPAEDGKSLAERLLDSERKEIVAAVEKSRGNIASAARMLGINRSTLYYRLRKHGLEHLLPTKVQVGGDEPEPGGAAPAGAASASHRRSRLRVRSCALLFILDPLERLELAGDTSYALMLEAAARG